MHSTGIKRLVDCVFVWIKISEWSYHFGSERKFSVCCICVGEKRTTSGLLFSPCLLLSLLPRPDCNPPNTVTLTYQLINQQTN